MRALNSELVAIAGRAVVQRGPGSRKLVKWRTGSEARSSRLKRDDGWRRTLTDGKTGAATWCGWVSWPQRHPRSAPSPSRQNDNGPPPKVPHRPRHPDIRATYFFRSK